jgi:hypothetical protein
VDVGIYFGKDLVYILEVDGPQHYRFDGKIKRKDKLKEMMYYRKHPDATFRRIRWDEANKVGFDTIGSEIVAQAVISSKSTSYINKAIKNVERAFTEFFSWGLRNTKSEYLQ